MSIVTTVFRHDRIPYTEPQISARITNQKWYNSRDAAASETIDRTLTAGDYCKYSGNENFPYTQILGFYVVFTKATSSMSFELLFFGFQLLFNHPINLKYKCNLNMKRKLSDRSL